MTFRPIALAALALAALPAAAETPVIVVDSPNFRPLPIAVADFQGDGDARAAAGDTAAIVRNDLALSGLFEVLDPKGFLADPSEGFAATSIKFARWSDVGAEALAKARLGRTGGAIEGELRLYEVRAGRELLAKVIQVPAAEPRRLAHRMADEIVRYYTREPGPFSSRIAAVRKSRGLNELVLFDVDGGAPQVLLSEKRSLVAPAWSPDGKQILVTSYRNGFPELWVYRLADRSLRHLPTNGNVMGGVYSPDGARIAYTVAEGGQADIWVMNADGSNQRQLTKDPPRQSALDLTPSWSPDGKRIVFSSDRAGTPQLYVMSADGGAAERITFQGNYNQTPQWSPRGDFIAFTARDERKVFDVFVYDVQAKAIRRVTQDQGRTNEEPTWAPNGRMLVFRTDRNGPMQLVVSNPGGDRQTVVVGQKGVELAAPAWGPAVE
jgi:TolB protein